MPELGLPAEGLLSLHLLGDHLGHRVSRVDVYRANGHHFLSGSLSQVPEEHRDQNIELSDLLLVVILHGRLVALLQGGEGGVHLNRPEYLSSGQGNLNQVRSGQVR